MRGAGDFQLAQALKASQKKVAVLEAKLKEAETVLNGYMFIDKKPDYYYSFSGCWIFRKWYINNGMTSVQAELLIIISYIDVFLTNHFKLYTRNYTRVPVKVVLDALVKHGYIIKIKVQGKNRISLRNGWVLTPRGKDLEADYERFYDECMAEVKKGELYSYKLEDGAYFRKVRLSAFDRRIWQGGGKLKRAGGIGAHAFVEPEVLNKRYEET